MSRSGGVILQSAFRALRVHGTPREKSSGAHNVVFERETLQDFSGRTKERHGKWNNAIGSGLTTTEAPWNLVEGNE
jgi:hypothetical protein